MERAVYLGRNEAGGCVFRLLDRANGGQEFSITAEHAKRLYPNGLANIARDAPPRSSFAMPLVYPKHVALPGQVFQPVADKWDPSAPPKKLRLRAIAAAKDGAKPDLMAYLPKASYFGRKAYLIDETKIQRAACTQDLMRALVDLHKKRLPLLLVDLKDPGHEPLEMMPHLVVHGGEVDPDTRAFLEQIPSNMDLAIIPVAQVMEIRNEYLKELTAEGQLTRNDCAFLTLDGFAPLQRRQGPEDWLKEAITSGDVLGAAGLAKRLEGVPLMPAADLEDCVEFLINGDMPEHSSMDPFDDPQAKAYQPSLSLN